MLVFAHISDLHLNGSDRNAERAERVMAYLNNLPRPLDAVLVTGDIADHGLASEYEKARKILSSPHQVLTCNGNHDVRAAYREVLLNESANNAPTDRLHEVGGVAFLLCDSTIPGRNDGILAEETLEWMDATLSDLSAQTPAFVCFHHPPVILHSPFIDALRQRGEQSLGDVVTRHKNVVAILCGHAHTAAASTFAGRPLLVAPGVVSTLKLPWEHGDALDYTLPPAVAFHILDDDQRLTTHYRVVP